MLRSCSKALRTMLICRFMIQQIMMSIRTVMSVFREEKRKMPIYFLVYQMEKIKQETMGVKLRNEKNKE